jgi:hypothetical protein
LATLANRNILTNRLATLANHHILPLDERYILTVVQTNASDKAKPEQIAFI